MIMTLLVGSLHIVRSTSQAPVRPLRPPSHEDKISHQLLLNAFELRVQQSCLPRLMSPRQCRKIPFTARVPHINVFRGKR